MSLTITENAAEEVIKIMKQNADEFGLDPASAVVRVAVQGGGCSGFSYKLDLEKQGKETDEIFDQHGVRIACDAKSLLYLNGTVIDYKTDGHMSRGFTFTNPNATSTCGCGSSFSA